MAHQLPVVQPRHALKESQTARHPVEHIQRTYLHDQQELKYFALSNVFGNHMVARLEMEKQILSSFQRLPGLRSEFCGLDTITQRDVQMGFEDVFGDSPFHQSAALPDVHLAMEAKLGMTKQAPSF